MTSGTPLLRLFCPHSAPPTQNTLSLAARICQSSALRGGTRKTGTLGPFAGLTELYEDCSQMCVCVCPKYSEPKCLVTRVWPRFDHKPSEVEGREDWGMGARTPDPYVHFRSELLLFLTTNNSGEARPSWLGSPQLFWELRSNNTHISHTEGAGKWSARRFPPSPPPRGRFFLPRAGCVESRSHKERLRAVTSRLLSRPGWQTTCRYRPAAARRFMLQHHRCIKREEKKEEIDVDAVESDCKKQTCHCTAM